MSAGKNLLRRAVLLGVESSYNTAGAALSIASDGIHVHDDFEVEPQYQHDGSRAGTAAGTSVQRGDAKSGRFTEFEIAHRIRCPGIAYAAGAKSTVDRLLRAHGYLATLVTTAGVEKITYTPFTDGTWESLYGDFYTGKERRSGTGIYVPKVVFRAERTGIPDWRFTLKGPIGLPSDVAVPAGTYPYNSVSLIKAAAAICTIQASGGGAFQGLVRDATITSERSIDERLSQALASGSHAGFQLGPYRQTMDLLVEATPLQASPYTAAAALDPFRLAEEATLVTVLVQYGAAQYNRYKFQSATLGAQVLSATQEREGSIRMWRLTIGFPPTSETADDGFSIITD